jgi:putative ABC transport system permease protein
VLALGLFAGVATSLVAAVVPARNAANVDPVEALQKSRHHSVSALETRARMVLAGLAFAAAIVCLAATDTRAVFYAGYVLALGGTVLIAPIVATAMARALRPLLKAVRPVEGALAADSLIQAPRRTSATVLALMLSLALIIGFAGMARASYASVLDWMNASLNADLFVMPSPRLDLRTLRFPASMAGELREVPGVARVQMFRNSRITFRGTPAMAAAIEMASVAETTRVRPVAGRADEIYRRAAAGEGFIVSDNLAQKLGLSVGEVLEVPAPGGTLSLPLLGVIVDYTDQQGTIFMDRSLWLEYWGDESVNDFRIFVEPGGEIADVRQRIVERYAGERQVFVLTSEQSRGYVLQVTDQWFGLMNVQVAVAVFVAVLGIVNSLTVSIADRQRELGVLQAVGALRGQVRRTIWLEALTVALLGVMLGCVVGALNLYYVLDIVQRDVAGLRLDYAYPLSTVFTLVPAMLLAAFVAALWPAEAAVRTPLVEALEYE